MSNLDDDQYQLLSDRLDFLDGRIDALEGKKERKEDKTDDRRAHFLEKVVVALMAIEVIEGIFEVLMYMHHG